VRALGSFVPTFPDEEFEARSDIEPGQVIFSETSKFWSVQACAALNGEAQILVTLHIQFYSGGLF
jgi:hypothetical protein